MECIVFNQSELDKAIASGCRSICLCDGDYRLDICENASYLAIGTVTAAVPAARAECEAVNMRFLNFEPDFSGGSNRAFVPLKFSGLSNSGPGSRSSVFGGSFSSSYRLSSGYRAASGGSFASSYRLYGSYFTRGSYYIGGSYRLRTSFSSSYTASYRLASSYAYSFSFLSSFKSSFKRRPHIPSSAPRRADNAPEYITVFGYGIDLI